MSKRAKRTTSEGIDVDTFKSWLQGVEDMQEPDWCPTLVQWKKIREKISLLEVPEEQPVQPQFPMTPVFPGPTAAGVHIRPRVMPANPPSALDAKPSDNNVAADGSFSSSFT